VSYSSGARRARVYAWTRRSAQQRMAAILINQFPTSTAAAPPFDGAQIEQIVNDALPLRHATAAGGQAIKQLSCGRKSLV
jgi:hypothetical protein